MTDLMRWSPFDEWRRFTEEVERELQARSRPNFLSLSAPVDLSSTEDGWRVRVALPGISPEHVRVDLAGSTLHVQASEQDGDRVVRRYEQVFTLPEAVDPEKIHASFRHGLLDIALPYKEAVKPRRIEISTDEAKQLPKAA
jgi:HSP20 family protein